MRPVLYVLCFIAAAAALRRMVALLLVQTSARAGQFGELDATFAARKALTLAHIVPALIFVLLLPLWFSARLRSKETLHRRISWALFVLGFIIGTTAIPLVATPVGGATELSAIIVFDGIFLLAAAGADPLPAAPAPLSRMDDACYRRSAGDCDHAAGNGSLLRHSASHTS
jgi:hypothetical protein